MRPVGDARDQDMFHRVVMNVIHVPHEVVLVTDGMFPKSSLPECKLAVCMTADADACSEQAGAEMSFDSAPALREIVITFRQGQDRVEVIRKNYDRIDREGALLAGHPKRRA